MSCKHSHSENPRIFNGEVAIHFPGLEGLDKPVVLVFLKLLICLNCGFTEFVVSKTELQRLVDSDGAGAA